MRYPAFQELAKSLQITTLSMQGFSGLFRILTPVAARLLHG
jgi:hypothetical protein